MELETDFNTAPIWDDYNEEKNFHRVLFRHGVPVQARELTQSQTIMQDQIERFGQNIFKDGTIVSGANFTFDVPYPYVKILDLQTDGQPVNASMYANTIIKNSANLTAIVLNTADGLESQNPNLNTLFVKYLNKSTSGGSTFANSEVISAYTRDYSILSVDIADGGSGYSNDDIVVFTSSTGDYASARVLTNNTGVVTDVIVTDGGNNYISVPSVSVANSTGGSANGSGISLLANNVIGQVTVASNTFVIGANTEYYPTGVGYSFCVSEGVIFQKGFFVRVDPQNIVVSKYTPTPHEIQVGFETVESVVNNSIDTSLLDNAQGTPNENAPGAFRLKLTPTLVTKTVEEATASKNFFSLVEYQYGKPIKQNQTSEYNTLGKEMAKRTSEESGNYVLRPFSINTDEITANTSHFQTRIGAGIAYVDGFRVQQYDTYAVPMRKGNDIQSVDNVSISTNYGNYVYINRLAGTIPFNINATISLRDDVYVNTSSTFGSELGTARVRNIVFDNESNGVQTYRLYLFDIRMSGGRNFTDVRAAYYAGTGYPDRGAANFVLEGGKAVLKESGFAPLVFRFGQKAIKTLRDESNNNDTIFTYTTIDTSVSFAANGTLQKNLTGSDVFPYSGTLNDIEERDVIFVARTSANSAAYTGTVSVSTTSANVTGTGTGFISNYNIGDYFIPAGGTARQITSIANNTFMTVASNNSVTNGAAGYYKHFPANEVIPFTSRTARSITASGSVMVATLGETISGTLSVNAIYNVRRSSALQLTKNINKNVIVKLSTATNAGSNIGPWCLGIPDVQKIVSVKKTTNADYTTAVVDVTSHFVLDTGQKDTLYGLAYLRKKPTSKLAIATNEYLTVTVDAFTHTDTGGGLGFFSVDSYPVDDATSVLPATAIRTQDIPMYVSPTSGAAYDLRDSVDFRPVVVKTANTATILGNATVNPAVTEVLAGVEKYVPAVNKTFLTDLQYYQGRFDIISLTSYGQFDVREGVSSDNPTPPSIAHGAMTIATVSIPPYPTLSTKSGSTASRPDYTVKVSTKQNKRYTMEDIGQLDSRLNRVEYYTALSLLEKQTSDLLIPSSIDPTLNRFKNGIFVEPFSSFAISNVLDGEFTAGIDESVGELIPRFTQNKFDLTVSGTTSLKTNKDIVTLDYTHAATLTQPYATRVRNCTENYWNFAGQVTLTPSYDNYYDTKKSPENTIVIDVDTASPTLSLLTELNNIKALNTTDTTSVVTSSTDLTNSTIRGGDTSVSHWVDETYTTVRSTTTTETKNMLVGQVNETIQKVGDFITDISFSPYIREQALRFTVTGLKPLTPVNAFFDKVKVTGFCQQSTFTPEVIYSNSWKKKTAIGSGLVTDETGTLYGVFYIPADSFFVGDRELKFLDIDSLVSESAASTSASGMFHAYNFSVTKSDVIVSTRSAEVSNQSTSASSTSTSRDQSTRSTFVEVPVAPTPPVITPPVVPPVVREEPDLMLFELRDANRQDPIAQTFSVARQQADNQDGIFISKVDLFFQRKDSNLGLTVQLRMTDNGYPSSTILPMGSMHIPSSAVNISSDGSAATTITFEAPIFIKTDQEYCVVVLPDGNSPEYLIYTAQGGQTDLANPNYTVRQDWGAGVLFTSTNNSAWQSIQDEDMKFTLYRSVFDSQAGQLTLTNRDDEFLTIGTANNTFLGGEMVFKLNTPIAGNVTFSTSSTTVNGTGTAFQSIFVVGQPIILSNTASPTVSSNFDIVRIASIANNTTLTVDSPPTFSASSVKALNAPVADVFFFDPTRSEMILTNSTAANSSFLFAAGDVIVGETLNGATTISSVNNKVISYYQPLIYRTTISGTDVTGTMQFANSSLQIQTPVQFKFNASNYLDRFEAYIGSKSNEILAGSGKSVRAVLNLTSINRNTTPTIDLQAASLLRYENIINNDSTDENTVNGELVSKYISKTVTLADGLDAEDVKVYVTGYQPSGTEIEVYIRALNSGDSDNLRDKSWTKLISTANTTSDNSNRNDFKEFEYTFGNTVPLTSATGVVSIANNSTTLSGIGTLFTSEIPVGTVIQIGQDSTSFISKVSTVASNTSITLTDAAPLALTGSSIHILTDGKAMFKDIQNDGVVTYYNNTSRFDKYKTFAIKVGLKSESTNLVPRVKDLSAIALSV